MAATPGNDRFVANQMRVSIHQAAVVDENYVIIGGHLDENLRNKIFNHEYVDFARLLPKDRMQREEDHRMEIINRNGATFFVPVSDRETAGSIANFAKWEQAFCVFSNVYTGFFPERATELIQYNQLIHTASLSFVWENVYRYDKEFRMHLSNFPQHNWGIVLQQAWSVYLKDRISNSNRQSDFTQNGKNNHNGKKKDICLRFNKGKCNKGFRCQFNHRCLGCGKFGHGVHICRDRVNQDTSNATNGAVVPAQKGSNNGNMHGGK